MELGIIEVLIAIFSGLSGGASVLFGYRLFKQKTEFIDEQQFIQISKLVKEQEVANKLQTRNNELQQKQLDATDKEVLLLRERFQHYREISENFQNSILEENKKTDQVLKETTKAITGLDATMQGLKELINVVIKRN